MDSEHPPAFLEYQLKGQNVACCTSCFELFYGPDTPPAEDNGTLEEIFAIHCLSCTQRAA